MTIDVSLSEVSKDLNVSELKNVTFNKSGSHNFTIPIINDNVTESKSNKTFTLTLRSMSPWSAKVVDPSKTHITLLDNDGKLTIFAREANL